MRLSARSQPFVKSFCYASLSLIALGFEASLFPALGISVGTPFLTAAIISALAMKEGINYASIFGAVFGALEAFVFGGSALVYVVFYAAFAFLCARFFGSFFSGGFFPWALFTLCGILLHAALRLFGPVSNWETTAAKILTDGALQSIIWSAVFSLPIYPIVAWIKRKTE